MRERELIVYKEFSKEEGSLFHDMAKLMEHYGDAGKKEKMACLCFDCMHRLLEIAENHGFYGNLWHCFLSNLLVNNEN
ncbi:MAG: AAA family ATPase, partial [Clostridium sp.]|nr:AAA family ATPase [Clostridium sp.]